jgi:hypothetical protein
MSVVMLVSARLMVTSQTIAPDTLMAAAPVPDAMTWRRGDLVTQNTTHLRRENGWQVRSRLPNDRADVSAHILDIASQLPDVKAFVRFGADVSIELGVMLKGITSAPAFRLTPQAMRALVELDATLDVDTLDMSQ